MKITVKDRQTLLDVAVQHLGSAEAVFALCERNGIDITDRLYDGDTLEWELEDVASQKVRDIYLLEAIEPATEITGREENELLTATAKWFKGCILPPYIWRGDLITNIGTERDNLTQRTDITTTAVEDITQRTVLKARRAAASGAEAPDESGTTLMRIFTDQFNDVFA